MTKKLDINSVINNEEGLTKEEKIARLKVAEKMATLDRPLNLDEVDLDQEMIRVLVKKDKIVLNDDGDKISFCYPISGQQTCHVVQLDDGRVFHSMCAIDALGASFTFGMNLTINSLCSVSGKEIQIRIEDGKIVDKNADDIYAIHMDLNTSDNWAASC